MQIEKLRSAALAAAIVVSIALSSAPSAAQQPSAAKPAATGATQSAPKSKDVMLAAIKALGGDEFFEPKPYTLSRSYVIHISDDGPKTIKDNVSYKNRKYYCDSTVLIKRIGKPFNYKSITDLDKNEMWDSEMGGAWKKANYILTPDIPFFGKNIFNDLIFDGRVPQIVKKDNEEYYKVEVKFTDPKWKDWTRVYLINKSNNLVYEKHRVNEKESMHDIFMYKDYTKVGNIMVPQKILEYDAIHKKNGEMVLESEITLSNFTFRDDIPDSLFVVPTKK